MRGEAKVNELVSMQRRAFLLVLGAGPLGLRAEHAWQPTPGAPPVYLEGVVTTIIWADPHPHLEMLHRAETRIPAELRKRRIPRQKDPVDIAELLARVVLPPGGGEVWRVDLPTLARLTKWDLPRPKIGDVIGVVGLQGPPMKDTPTVRAEILFLAKRAFPLRSDPA